jgi:tetratricopeptide (TPR) repeat protein
MESAMARKRSNSITDTGETRPRSLKSVPRQHARPSRSDGHPEDDTTVVNIAEGPAALAAALQHCLANPEERAGWDALERAAETRADTQHVAELHRATLQRDLPKDLLLEIAERAVRFHDEWALEDEELISLLVRVLTIDPTAKWAFDRVSLELTMRDRREELLWLYDQVLAAIGDGPRRIALLEEAADVARQTSGQIDRAIGYLDVLFSADPRRTAIAASLERLLTQQRRHADLLALWTRRMEVEGPAEAAKLRCRAASFCLETMGDPAATLAALAPLEERRGAEGDAVCRILEQVLESPSSTSETRREALERLRRRYDGPGRGAELVRPLLAALRAAEDADVVALRSEIAQRLVAAKRDDEATEHLAVLVSIDAAQCDDARLDQLLAKKLEGEIFGCRPRLDRDGRRELVRRAAAHAASVGASERAIHLYRRLLRDLPGDARIVAGLAELYRAGEQHAELIELHEHELGLEGDAKKRSALRLELARLHLVLEDTRAAVAVLRGDLDEQPADEATIAGVVSTLEASGSFAALCDLLEEHAEKIAAQHADVSAGLWTRAAEIAEKRVADAKRAVRGHERAVAIAPKPESLDALGRINAELGEHAAAARWLADLVACARPGEHASDVFRLATERVAIGQPAEARACIEAFLAEEPGDMRLRAMQVDLLRAAGDREALVAALVDAAPHADDAAASSLLREAAKVLVRDLQAPARAVALLERVAGLPGVDPSARIELADALHRAGRLAEAQEMAKDVLGAFGRRRPPSRAGVHLLLARIAQEEGHAEDALRELQAAVTMDVGDARAQLMLGKVSRELGHLEGAERAFNALLLLQRRAAAAGDEPPMAETLVELHRLAALRGNAERAAENLAAAFDVAQRSEREARGLEHALRDAQMTALHLRALETHLARSPEPTVRATLLGELSDALGAVGRHDEAANAALEAVALAPQDRALHRRAVEACAKTDQLGRCASSLEGLVASALESGDGVLGCDLLLRLGEVHETDSSRLDEARVAYARAEDTSENLIDVWRHQARLAERRGDRETQLAVLRKLGDSASDLPVAERADTLYALAELELATSEGIQAGLSSLGLAMEAEARPARAVALLREALDVAGADREAIARLYESVARAHGDEAMLLDALTVACGLPRPAQATLREAAELAERAGAEERAVELLERAAAVAREGVDPGEGLWAMRELVDRSQRRGDVRAAVSWAKQAAEAAEADEAAELWMRAAALATGAGDVDGALDCYEKRLASDPSDAKVWAAMLALLRDAGDAERLDAALVAAVEVGQDPKERNDLRMERARRLLDDAAKRSEALDTLHAVLDEQPDHTEAAGLLVSLLDPEAEHDDLVALLTRRLEVAQERGNADVAATLALRLADLLAPAEALEVVREALRSAPASVPLLRRQVDLLEPQADATERADAVERLLEHEQGDARLSRALDLLRARLEAEDAGAVERAIASVSEIDPAHADVVTALRWLADARIAEAAGHPDAARLLRSAAEIERRLGDADAALETLEQAQRIDPDDLDLLGLRVHWLLDAQRGGEAMNVISDALGRCSEPAARAERLAVRASLSTALGDHFAAVADLQDAADTGGDRWLPELLSALDQARSAPGSSGSARTMTLREAEVLERLDRGAEARALLAGIDADGDVLRRMLDLDVAGERWDAAIDDCRRLFDVVEGPELSAVALRLADAFEHAGRPDAARFDLERALDDDPSSAEVLERLRAIYVRTGEHRELANRLFADAQRTTDDQLRFERLLEVGRLRVEHLGAAAAAVGPLSDALAMRPGHLDATLLLADALSGAGLTDDAMALLDASIAEHGGRRSRALGELQHRMARVVGKRDAMAGLRWLVLAFESHTKNAVVAEELAGTAIALGQLDTALRALRILTSRDFEPEVRARAYVGQADVALRQANGARALMFAKKAYAEAPGLPAVGHLLQRLEQRA